MNDSTTTLRTMRTRALTLALLGLLAAPGAALAQTSDTDDAPADGTPTDAPPTDAAPVDGAPADAAPVDAASVEDDDASSTSSDTSTDASTTDTSTTTATTDATSTTPDASTTPSDEETEEEADEVQAEHEPLAWRNTFFSYTLGSTFNTLCRGCQLSYNPTVYSTFFLTPRWYLEPSTFFVVNQGLFVEHTGDDAGTYNSEWQLYDTTVEIRHVESVEGFAFLPAFRLTLPVSKLSQAAQRYFNLAVGLTAVRPIPEAAGLTFALSFRYQRWFAGSNVPLTHSPYPATTGSGAPLTPPPLPCQDASSCASQASGSTSEVDRIVAGLTISVAPFENFTLTLQTFFIWGNGYGLRDEQIATATGNVLVGDGHDHWRVYSSYSLQAAYDIVPWFNLALGITNATNLEPFFSENGDVRSPFNPNTQFYLSATITLDSLYESFAASGEDDGLTPEQRQRRRQGLAQRTSTGGSL